jgi:hypothetical protein
MVYNGQKTSPNSLIYLGDITKIKVKDMKIDVSAKNPLKSRENRVSENKNNYIGKISLPQSVEVHRMKLRPVLMIALLTVTLFSAIMMMIPQETEASPITVVTLNLQPEPPQVDVSPGSSGIVTLQGTVYCLKYGPDQVKVNLIGSSDIAGASVIPPNMVFGGAGGSEETRSFAVTTRVPQGTTFTATPTVTVSGNFIQGGLQYNIPPVQQLIEILPYYKLEVDTPPPQEIGAGEFVYFAIKITNVGNTEDTYEFIFDNLEDLQDKEWTVATITPKTYIEDETKTITVSAQAPQTWTIWRNEVQPFNLRIVSQQAAEEGGDVKYFVPLYVRQKGIYIPGFSPMFAIMGIGAVALIMGKRRLGT